MKKIGNFLPHSKQEILRLKGGKMKTLNKRGQVTIFIIIAILIVAAIALFFLFRQDIILLPGGGADKNPKASFQNCIEDELREASDLISSQGGYVNPVLYKELDNKKISYLCYNSNYYESCINQEPMLIQHIKEEIKNQISEKVESCFKSYESGLKNAGYSMYVAYRDFDVQLVPNKILIDVDAEITTERNGETSTEEGFVVMFLSKIYDLAIVAQEITSQEARFCNFEQLGYMLLYPQFEIDKFRTGDGDTIYTIQDRKTEEKFKFAVRSCVIPPGF